MTEQVAAIADKGTQLTIGVAAIQVVAVVFNDEQGQKEYNYFAPKEARAGQYAVVYQEIRGNDGFPFKIVRIVRDNVLDLNGQATKSIWGSFDENFAKQVQLRTEHLQRVKSQLQMKKKQFEEREVFAMMAQNDPEVAALLKEMQDLGA